MENLIKASWYRAMTNGKFQCELCFHKCLIKAGSRGLCVARGVSGQGEFISPYLGCFYSTAIDPIEKKPLYNWNPGTYIFSVGSLGCNMKCGFCQNYKISQPQWEMAVNTCQISPAVLRDRILAKSLNSIAYTYNEPVLQTEFIVAAGPVMREAGIATVMVSNGMILPKPLETLAPHIDAVNIDVKTFDSSIYKHLGGSLSTVKNTVSYLFEKGVHVEITNLVVPKVSDSKEQFVEMVDWIASLSPEIALHISRYFPAYKSMVPATDVDLMIEFKKLAMTKLKNVYLGNV